MTIQKESWSKISPMIRKKSGIERLNKKWSVIDKQFRNRIWTIGHNASALDRYLFLLTAWLRPELCHPSMDRMTKFNWIARKWPLDLASKTCILTRSQMIKQNLNCGKLKEHRCYFDQRTTQNTSCQQSVVSSWHLYSHRKVRLETCNYVRKKSFE